MRINPQRVILSARIEVILLLPFTMDGYIDPGLHTYNHIDFMLQFVNNFPTSQSRLTIFRNSICFLHDISKITTPLEVWIDGSYVSTKVNPRDMDIVFFIDKANLTVQFETNFKALKDRLRGCGCDAYYGIINNQNATNDDINMRNYWKGQFGYDRTDKPKGIIVLPWPEVEEAIKKVVGQSA